MYSDVSVTDWIRTFNNMCVFMGYNRGFLLHKRGRLEIPRNNCYLTEGKYFHKNKS